jgi:hypothetical protein
MLLKYLSWNTIAMRFTIMGGAAINVLFLQSRKMEERRKVIM